MWSDAAKGNERMSNTETTESPEVRRSLPPLVECKCKLAQRAVGDGCEICNPDLAAEYERMNHPPCMECGAMTETEARRHVATPH